MIHVALITRPQKERAAVAELRQRYDASAFFPVQRAVDKRRSKREGKAVHRDALILPRYVFCEFQEAPKWFHLFERSQYITDAIRVSSGHVAVLHPDDLRIIHSLRSRVEDQKAAEKAAKMLRPGDVAHILGGPLAGQEVEIIEVKSGNARFKFRIFDSERIIEAPVSGLLKAAE